MCNSRLIIDLFPDNISSRKSTTFTSGNLELLALFFNSNRLISCFSALKYVSISGVALPKTRHILFCLAIYLATSFALYFGVVSDLYELSCSSSITISPRLFTGANIALLGPIIIFASPLSILFHWSYFSPIDSLLCNTAILSSPNLAINLSTVCGVSEISGTSIMLLLSFFKQLSINCK